MYAQSFARHHKSPSRPIGGQVHPQFGGDSRHRLRQILRPGTVTATIQPSLKVGAADDHYEREADEVANKVMNTPDSAVADSFDPMTEQPVQRMCEECEEEGEPEVQRKANHSEAMPTTAPVDQGIKGLSNSGSALSEQSRAFFEPRFGRDFSQVQIHTGSHAETLASAINARAFTYANHIVFGEGEYQPDTDSGKRLLSHELTHVVQQGHGQTPAHIQRQQIPQELMNSADLSQLSDQQLQERYNKLADAMITINELDPQWALLKSEADRIQQALSQRANPLANLAPPETDGIDWNRLLADRRLDIGIAVGTPFMNEYTKITAFLDHPGLCQSKCRQWHGLRSGRLGSHHSLQH